ncbi:methyltransferase domain-containing protein [Pseudomonas sp. PSKL.D1]|uniref:methyltransferase domain-containing protein n=1 Tax=Pseudomonas sp. PSKL.D1 TaxID=3029060 RepID=UPI0023812B56|nr:methyltransferase domain-containing protein [Pseudomonas sp. PSKL.D1]WDY59859.1 methyltransferase domain-containing protein [Pseudomonas sp. PSKL.D1]
MREEETAEFWGGFAKDDLMQRCASLHQMRREAQEAKGAEEIQVVRRTIAELFVSGKGIEVGAGSRPFPIPNHASCFYGDVRDRSELAKYFSTDQVTFTGHIDAQTLEGIPDGSLDFIISAHVIEHLFNPLGALHESIKRLRSGGVLVLVVPELTQNWDRRRPPTTLQHLIGDMADNGESTRLQAYIEHCRYVHPEMTGETIQESEIEHLARQTMAQGMDLHVHAWREEDFWQVIQHVISVEDCRVEARLSAVNENIYVLRKGL